MVDTAKLRKLGEAAARRCEEACNPRCRCRCGGALHGAKRAPAGSDTPREWFEQLPEDDPHKVRERKPGVVTPKPPKRKRGATIALPFDL